MDLIKLAFKPVTPKFKVEEFHATPKKDKDWKRFEGNLRSKGFVALLKADPRTDPKLSHYATALHEYKVSKKVEGKVPSRTEFGTSHKIKRLPDGRLGCDCGDWQYKHSHKGSDCDHIKKFKGIEKAAAIHPLAKGLQRGVKLYDFANRSANQWNRGSEAKERKKH